MKCSTQRPGLRTLLHRLIGFGLVGLLLAGTAACSQAAATGIVPGAPTPQLEPQVAGLKFYEFYSPL